MNLFLNNVLYYLKCNQNTRSYRGNERTMRYWTTEINTAPPPSFLLLSPLTPLLSPRPCLYPPLLSPLSPRHSPLSLSLSLSLHSPVCCVCPPPPRILRVAPRPRGRTSGESIQRRKAGNKIMQSSTLSPQETRGATRRAVRPPSRSKTNASQAIPENSGLQSKSHAVTRSANNQSNKPKLVRLHCETWKSTPRKRFNSAWVMYPSCMGHLRVM